MKLVAVLVSVIIAVMLSLVGVEVYLRYFERPYLSYGPQPFPVEGESVEVGKVIPVWVTRCNDTKIVQFYRVTHTLKPLSPELASVVMPSELTHIAPGCQTVKSGINKIPLSTAPGRYFIDGGAEVPGIRKAFYVSWSTPPFNVTEAAK